MEVGIGVATGADQVFITNDCDLVEPDRMLPLAMTADLASGEFRWSGRYLVNPWSADGKLVTRCQSIRAWKSTLMVTKRD